jgi:two-component system, LytTR family, sensor kinase
MKLGRAQLLAGAAAFWTLFGVVCALQIWLSMLEHHHSLVRLTLYQIAVWDVWVVVALGIARLVRRFPVVPPSSRNLLLHLLCGVIVGVLHGAWWVALELLIVPYDRMNPTVFTRPFVSTAFYQMPLELLLYALVVMTLHAADSYARQREREMRTVQLEKSLAEARLHALELQIQPHFLFNTLNAVSALIRTGAHEQALDMIGGLSDLLRYALDRSGGPSIALADEVEMVRRYLEIQRIRFPDRLSYTIEVEPGVDRAAVPVLLLQPLAENAVHHGLAASQGSGRVELRAARDGDALRIRIWNSGRLGAGREGGIGLANVAARLRQLHGERQALELREEAAGVLAQVTLPWNEAV